MYQINVQPKQGQKQRSSENVAAAQPTEKAGTVGAEIY